ncbi:MAG: threonylcarbamoyl-AMP synthase [Myxococcales bacterium]|nr:threonylcarbamoyl-AMP synthase [Myxococcales bacterium]
MPRVLPALEPESIALAARLLRAGELVAFPTETVYGLGARALDPVHTARIFAAKGRPTTHPLIAHVDGPAMARELVASWGPAAEALAAAFWPGPLTLVLERASHVPSGVAGGGTSIAVRVPGHPCALALIRALGEPIAAPSANRYQGLSPTVAAHVVRSLGDAVALVLDGGPCEAGVESTVVDLRSPIARVLRPGAVPLDALAAVWPVTRAEGPQLAAGERASPGLDAKHYAPRARLLLCARGTLGAQVADQLARGVDAVGALVTEGSSSPPGARLERLDATPTGYAHGLFAALHRLDEAGVSVVLAEAVPDTDAWAAVRDRLTRAASL